MSETIPELNAPISANRPLNGEEILEGFKATGFSNTDYRLRCFIEGVRWAEKMRKAEEGK